MQPSSQTMYDPHRHEPLIDDAWAEGPVRDGVAAVCRDLEAAFDPWSLWPLHPRDWEPGTADVVRGLYLGAAGVLLGLGRLASTGVWEPGLDLAALAAGLEPIEDEEGAGASLLAGTSGILLVARRADALAEAVASNASHPSNEVLLGSPGTMLAARAMWARAGEERFADLWRSSAQILLSRMDADGLWEQDLYGTRRRLLGAGHGFAGNMHVLLAAPEWLDDGVSVAARAVATLRAFAVVSDDGCATWPPVAGSLRPGEVPRVQWCHGSPGVIVAFARVAPDDAELTALLEAGGELTWRAGPLVHNAGLCHGAAGNGFAFLALFDRTGDERWLARARAFAVHALAQVERFRAADGRGRYSLFTGGLGAALLAASCLTLDARFPGLDDL
jgi:hypothetical protein